MLSNGRVTVYMLCVVLFSACIRLPTPELAEPQAIDGLLNCVYHTPSPEHTSLLPAFEPTQPCALENIEVREDVCMVNASPDLQYPCYNAERVAESVLAEDGDTVLIQRDYHIESGCWTMTSTDIRSLRVCERATGDSEIVAEDVLGPFSVSPDGNSLVYVEPEPESYRTRPHIYRANMDGSGVLQLDTQSFPHEVVSGATIEAWSADGEWLKIRLWDGKQDGYHRYLLRADGSGEYTVLP